MTITECSTPSEKVFFLPDSSQPALSTLSEIALSADPSEDLFDENERDRIIKAGVKEKIIDPMGNKITEATIDLAAFEEEARKSTVLTLRKYKITRTTSYGMVVKADLADLFLAALSASQAELPIIAFQNVGTDTISSMNECFGKALKEAVPNIEISHYFKTSASDTDWRIVIKKPKEGEVIKSKQGEVISFWNQVESCTKAILRKVAAVIKAKILMEPIDIAKVCADLGIIYEFSMDNYISLRFIQSGMDILIGNFKSNYLNKNTAILREIDPTSLTEDLSKIRVSLNASGVDPLHVFLLQNYGIVTSANPELQNDKASIQVLRRALNCALGYNNDFVIFAQTLLNRYPINDIWPQIIASKFCDIIKGHTNTPIAKIIWLTLSFEANLEFVPEKAQKGITQKHFSDLWKSLPETCFRNEVSNRQLFNLHIVYHAIVDQGFSSSLVIGTLGLAGLLSLATPGKEPSQASLKITPTRHTNNRTALSFLITENQDNNEFILDFNLAYYISSIDNSLSDTKRNLGDLIPLFLTFCTVLQKRGIEQSSLIKHKKKFHQYDLDKALQRSQQWTNSTSSYAQLCGVALCAFLAAIDHPKADEYFFISAIPILIRSKETSLKELGIALGMRFIESTKQCQNTQNIFVNEERKLFNRKQWYQALASTQDRRLCEIVGAAWGSAFLLSPEVRPDINTFLTFYENVLKGSPSQALYLLREVGNAHLPKEDFVAFFEFVIDKITTLPERHPFIIHLEDVLILANTYLDYFNQAEKFPPLYQLYQVVNLHRKSLLPYCFFWQPHFTIESLSSLGINSKIESIYFLAAKSAEFHIDKQNIIAEQMIASISDPGMFIAIQSSLVKRVLKGEFFNNVCLRYVQTLANPLKFRVETLIRMLRDNFPALYVLKPVILNAIEELSNLKEKEIPNSLSLRILKAYTLSYNDFPEQLIKLANVLAPKRLKSPLPMLDGLAEILCHKNCFDLLIEDKEFQPKWMEILESLLFMEKPSFESIKKIIPSLYQKTSSKPEWSMLLQQAKMLALHFDESSLLDLICELKNPSQILQDIIQNIKFEKLTVQAAKNTIQSSQLLVDLIKTGETLDKERKDQLSHFAIKTLDVQLPKEVDTALNWINDKKTESLFGQTFIYRLLLKTYSCENNKKAKESLFKALSTEGKTSHNEPSLVQFATLINEQWASISKDWTDEDKWSKLALIYPWLPPQQHACWLENTSALNLLKLENYKLTASVFLHKSLEQGLPENFIQKFQVFFNIILHKNDPYLFSNIIPFIKKYKAYLNAELWEEALNRIFHTNEKKDFATVVNAWFSLYPFAYHLEEEAWQNGIHLLLVKKLYLQSSYQEKFFEQPDVVLTFLELDEDVESCNPVYQKLLEHLLIKNTHPLTALRLRNLLSNRTPLASLLELDIQLALFPMVLEDEMTLTLFLNRILQGFKSRNLKQLSAPSKKLFFQLLEITLKKENFLTCAYITSLLDIFVSLEKDFCIEDRIWLSLLKYLIGFTLNLDPNISTENSSDEYSLGILSSSASQSERSFTPSSYQSFIKEDRLLYLIQKCIFNILKNASNKSPLIYHKDFTLAFEEDSFEHILLFFTKNLSKKISVSEAIHFLTCAIQNKLAPEKLLKQGLFQLTDQDFREKENTPDINDFVTPLQRFKKNAIYLWDYKGYEEFCIDIVMPRLIRIYTHFCQDELFFKTVSSLFNSTFLNPLENNNKIFVQVESFTEQMALIAKGILILPGDGAQHIRLRIAFINTLLDVPLEKPKDCEIISHLGFVTIKTLLLNYAKKPFPEELDKLFIDVLKRFFFLPIQDSRDLKKQIELMQVAIAYIAEIESLKERHIEQILLFLFYIFPENHLCIPGTVEVVPPSHLVERLAQELPEGSKLQYLHYIERLNCSEVIKTLQELPPKELHTLIHAFIDNLSIYQLFPRIYFIGYFSILNLFISHNLLNIPDPTQNTETLDLYIAILKGYLTCLQDNQTLTKDKIQDSIPSFLACMEFSKNIDPYRDYFNPKISLQLVIDLIGKMKNERLLISSDRNLWEKYEDLGNSLLHLLSIFCHSNKKSYSALDNIVSAFCIFDGDPQRFGTHFFSERQKLALKYFIHTLSHQNTFREETYSSIACFIKLYPALLKDFYIFYQNFPKELHHHIPKIFNALMSTSQETFRELLSTADKLAEQQPTKETQNQIFYSLMHYMSLLQLFADKSNTENYFFRRLYSFIDELLEDNLLDQAHELIEYGLSIQIIKLQDPKASSVVAKILKQTQSSSSLLFHSFFDRVVMLGWHLTPELEEQKQEIIQVILKERYLTLNLPQPFPTSYEEWIEKLFLHYIHTSAKKEIKWIESLIISLPEAISTKIWINGMKNALQINDPFLAMDITLNLPPYVWNKIPLKVVQDVFSNCFSNFSPLSDSWDHNELLTKVVSSPFLNFLLENYPLSFHTEIIQLLKKHSNNLPFFNPEATLKLLFIYQKSLSNLRPNNRASIQLLCDDLCVLLSITENLKKPFPTEIADLIRKIVLSLANEDCFNTLMDLLMQQEPAVIHLFFSCMPFQTEQSFLDLLVFTYSLSKEGYKTSYKKVLRLILDKAKNMLSLKKSENFKSQFNLILDNLLEVIWEKNELSCICEIVEIQIFLDLKSPEELINISNKFIKLTLEGKEWELCAKFCMQWNLFDKIDCPLILGHLLNNVKDNDDFSLAVNFWGKSYTWKEIKLTDDILKSLNRVVKKLDLEEKSIIQLILALEKFDPLASGSYNPALLHLWETTLDLINTFNINHYPKKIIDCILRNSALGKDESLNILLMMHIYQLQLNYFEKDSNILVDIPGIRCRLIPRNSNSFDFLSKLDILLLKQIKDIKSETILKEFNLNLLAFLKLKFEIIYTPEILSCFYTAIKKCLSAKILPTKDSYNLLFLIQHIYSRFPLHRQFKLCSMMFCSKIPDIHEQAPVIYDHVMDNLKNIAEAKNGLEKLKNNQKLVDAFYHSLLNSCHSINVYDVKCKQLNSLIRIFDSPLTEALIRVSKNTLWVELTKGVFAHYEETTTPETFFKDFFCILRNKTWRFAPTKVKLRKIIHFCLKTIYKKEILAQDINPPVNVNTYNITLFTSELQKLLPKTVNQYLLALTEKELQGHPDINAEINELWGIDLMTAVNCYTIYFLDEISWKNSEHKNIIFLTIITQLAMCFTQHPHKEVFLTLKRFLCCNSIHDGAFTKSGEMVHQKVLNGTEALLKASKIFDFLQENLQYGCVLEFIYEKKYFDHSKITEEERYDAFINYLKANITSPNWFQLSTISGKLISEEPIFKFDLKADDKIYLVYEDLLDAFLTRLYKHPIDVYAIAALNHFKKGLLKLFNDEICDINLRIKQGKLLKNYERIFKEITQLAMENKIKKEFIPGLFKVKLDFIWDCQTHKIYSSRETLENIKNFTHDLFYYLKVGSDAETIKALLLKSILNVIDDPSSPYISYLLKLLLKNDITREWVIDWNKTKSI